MMRGLLSNGEEIARRILMVHFPLPLRLLFSESIVYCNRQKYFLPIRKKITGYFEGKKSRLCSPYDCKELCLSESSNIIGTGSMKGKSLNAH